ncbi:MAG TPA: hypothetical protein VJS12_10795 [Steroidobacteraceae bacterium]|nr:hypothetical protein [Steroidobacteraceae bacterium]
MRAAFIPWIALSVIVLASGEIALPSGSITLRSDAEVTGNVETDSGVVRVEGAHVGGRIETTSGDIYIGPDSRIDGGILVQRRGLIGFAFGDFRLGIPVGSSTTPRVVIGPRASVAGVLRFKRDVELLVSDSATIGPVHGATPVMFATEQPPARTIE